MKTLPVKGEGWTFKDVYTVQTRIWFDSASTQCYFLSVVLKRYLKIVD